MNEHEVRVALDCLPRFTSHKNKGWPVDGKFTMFNGRLLPDNIDKLVRKIVKQSDYYNWPSTVQTVDPRASNVWVLHRHVLSANLAWFLRRGWGFQRWKKSKLPIYLKLKGKLIVWNGTHRSLLCRLAGKRLRTRVIDLDAYAVWRKANPKALPIGTRVINFGKAKRGNRK